MNRIVRGHTKIAYAVVALLGFVGTIAALTKGIDDVGMGLGILVGMSCTGILFLAAILE